MIEWAIETALGSELFDRVIVSTDDSRIAEIAMASGAEVPFTRSEALSDDATSTMPVVADAIDLLDLPVDSAHAVCCIYPTTPLLEAADLERALTLWSSSEVAFTFAAYRVELPILRAFTKGPRGRAELLFAENANRRTQDLPEVYLDAGQFYFGSTLAWTSYESLIGANSNFIEIPSIRAIDIDTEDDWQQAEEAARHLDRAAACRKLES
jgi:N-acylneuraminate cytidylyltransferase